MNLVLRPFNARSFGILILFSIIVMGTIPVTNTMASSGVTAHNSYPLSPGDKLKINVFGEDELSGEYEVDAQGNISMPLIGQVNATDLTVGELQKKLTKELSDGYLVNPKVSMEVLSFRPFYIVGEVQDPGSYPYESSLNVLKAVAKAGGFTHRAVKDEFIIFRGEGEEKERIDAAPDTPVLPGDSIQVDERFF